MSKWSFGKMFFFFLLLLVLVGAVARFFLPQFNAETAIMKKDRILHLEINGVILNGKKFLDRLKNNYDVDGVKAILVEINSPGGAVGPSQELYYELKRVKEETKKPVVCVATSLIASGGYYAAMACDKLIVTPGALVGSIGVIMQFANLEELYGWAKIKKYNLKSGKFKDSGSEDRPMRDDERELFQGMIDEVHAQFKKTVAEGRKLDEAVVAEYADGRVMTGQKAVELKLADETGTFEDAVQRAAEMAGLKEDEYQLFKPRREPLPWYEEVFSPENDGDDLNSEVASLNGLNGASGPAALRALKSINQNGQITAADVSDALSMSARKLAGLDLLNQPLYLMPGLW